MPPLPDASGTDPDEVSHAEQRARWMEGRRQLGDDPDGLIAAGWQARAAAEALEPKAPPGAPGSRNWTPMGPSTLLGGQAFGGPSVAGRIRRIEVAPGSTRAYVGSADGGLWMWSRNTAVVPPADRWQPSNEFVQTTGNLSGGVNANALSVGDLVVQFGAAAINDTIVVGTGEAYVARAADHSSVARAGVGVLVSPPPVAPATRSWNLEATNLAGRSVFRMVIDSDNATQIWAATTVGLFLRPNAAYTSVQAAWNQIGTGGANPLPAGLASSVCITGSGAGKQVYVAMTGTANAAQEGVYRSPDNGANWFPVPGIQAVAGNVPGNMALAASIPAAGGNGVVNGPVVYCLDQRARLRRTSGAPEPPAPNQIRFRTVNRLPNAAVLYNGQGWYDEVVAVDPGNQNTVYLLGATVRSRQDPSGRQHWELSGYKSTVTASGNAFRFGFNTAANNNANRAHRDASYIGEGVHADAHCLAFGRLANGNLDPTDVWIGCDGGVFRSTASGANASFQSMNPGLAIAQQTYLDQHPVHDSLAVAGAQDNGVQLTHGAETWWVSPQSDGGGCAIDPSYPYRMLVQNFQNTFLTTRNGAYGGEWQAFGLALGAGEVVQFYSPIAAAPAPAPYGGSPALPLPAPSAVAVGTNRVRMSTDWGASWATLGTGLVNNQLDAGNTPVTALVWASPNRLYGASQRSVWRFDLVGVNWNATNLGVTNLPPGNNIIGLAIANAANDDIYVSLGGGAANRVWWFDPIFGQWFSTQTQPAGPRIGFDVPTDAVAVDSTNANIVYAGTEIGVFQSTRTPVAPVPAPPPAPPLPRWQWSPWTLQSPGLPEAAIVDMKVHNPTNRMRVTTHGRGMWELQLGINTGADPDVYTRMNSADSGRRLAAARTSADPTYVRANGTTVNVDWTASPDIRVRRGIAAQPAPPYVGPAIRLRSPRTSDARVRRLQRHLLRRGFNLGPFGADGTFGPTTDAAVREQQRRRRLVVWQGGPSVDGIVGRGTWDATVGYPALDLDGIDHRIFTDNVAEDHDDGTRIQITDATGTNRVFAQIHSRGARISVAPAALQALLVVAPFAAMPQLPAGYGARVQAGDTSNWLGASGWRFADPASPYSRPTATLTAREPVIVEWNVDFSAIGLPAGTVDVIVLLLVSTTAEPLTEAERRPQQLVEGSTRVAARRLRLDPVAVIP